MRKRFFGACFLLLLACYISSTVFIKSHFTLPAADTLNTGTYTKNVSPYKEDEEAVFKFVTEYMLGKNGEIFTNVRAGEGARDTLSESVGLLMNYCVKRNKKDLFQLEYRLLKDKMMERNSFIHWRYGWNLEVTCNSLIDDFRIIRALLDGYEKWGIKEYRDMAFNLQDAALKKQTDRGKAFEFFDWKYNIPKKTVPLCYLDLSTMDRLVPFCSDWVVIRKRSADLIKRGRISGERPFFYKYFDYGKEKYIPDEEFAKARAINNIYNIYTAIQLAAVKEKTPWFSAWLKDELSRGKVYGWYRPETGEPSQWMECPAVYALAAVYAKYSEDEVLYREMMDKTLSFMVRYRSSMYFGGIGSRITGEFYSFDNLTALWALSLAGE